MIRIGTTALLLLIGAFAGVSALAAPVTWISSTGEQLSRTMPAPALESGRPEAPPHVRAVPERTAQTIDGFGGCFNEAGWVALGKLPEAERQRVFAALFGDDGCAFALARVPVGASDFALDAYSLADTPDDFELRHFSLERDRRHLLPYIKAAMAVRPALRCWGSPWSPPAWMKTNRHYSKGSLRWEPAILRTYATYLARWVEAYRAEGVDIYALAPQNEPNILNVYPTCLWTAAQLREFVADHLGPTLRDRKTNVELWLGLNGDPFNGGENLNDRLLTVLEDPAAAGFLTGVAFQYDSRNQIAAASALYPAKKFMQSETECNRGENSWADAQRLYGLMRRYLAGGAGSYFAWNLVLDETGLSTWKWRQNALVTVDGTTGQVAYNGEFHVMRHFSRFVRPGAKRILTTGPWSEQIAFVNPDGSTVFVVANPDATPRELVVAIAGRADSDTFAATLPAQSVNTFVVAPEPAARR
ncbi:MAG: glycosyl hydrolase [Opitutae bacterium]|nr:glycosyl hydrolase [Opitutae bacterium]